MEIKYKTLQKNFISKKFNKKTLAASFFILTSTLLSGCTNNISFRVIDDSNHSLMEGAKCFIHDSKNKQHQFDNNPYNIKFDYYEGPLYIKCEKDGYKQTKVLTGTAESVTTGLGGEIGTPVSGLISVKDNKYPSQYIIVLEKIEKNTKMIEKNDTNK